MGRALLRAGAVTAVLLACSTAPAAHAVDGASIAHVERTGAKLQVLVSVPARAKVDLGSVTVTIDGTDAPATARPAGTTTEVRRTAVLAIDASNSMRGERFRAAQAAAKTFLDTVPDDVYVGIVSFNSTVEESLAPTLDRQEAADIVEGLTLSSDTRLYDGVLSAVDLAGDDGQRSLLVLSDGADTSDTQLGEVTKRVRGADVLLDAVALEQGGAIPAPLKALASAGDGSVVQANAAALRRTFSAEADVLARQVLVTAQVPDTVTAEEATVALTLGSSAGDLTAQAFTPLGGRQTKPSKEPTEATGVIPAADPAPALTSTWLYGGLAALVLGLLTVLFLLRPRPVGRLGAADVASAYTDRVTGRVEHQTKPEAEPALEQAKEAAAKVLSRSSSLEERIAVRLDGAGSDLKPSEWLLVHIGCFLGAGLLGLLLGGGNLVLGILFLVLGAWIPWLFLGFKRNRRRKKFEGSLPDTLQLMSGSLAAGLSLAQSIDTIVREGGEPVAGEFRRVLVETRLGISLDEALEGVAERFESQDFGWVVMAIRIQRQVGGNLAELLNTVAETMREREYMRRQVAALSAEGRMSAYVLGGLPPMFMLYLYFTNRPYVMLFFTEPIGWAMLAGLGMLLGLGIFWMLRLVKVEV